MQVLPMKTLSKYLLGTESGNRDWKAISDAISKLPPDNKNVIELHFVQERTRNEIASDLGWSLSKVNQKITRGITLLKAEVYPEYFQKIDDAIATNAQRLLRK